MDLKQLEYFLAVAEERSVTRAAVRLHLTQPPLSAQLARLEHELGVPLLIRHRRGVDLTEAGRVLAERARRLLAEAEAAAEEVTGTGQGRSGRLTVAFVAATARPCWCRCCAGSATTGPTSGSGWWRTARTPSPGTCVSAGPSSDCSTCRPPALPRGVGHDLDVAVVRREPLVAVLPREAAARFGDRVDLGALADAEFLVPARAGSGSLAAHLVGACRLSGFDPVRREVQLVQTAVALVGAGAGVAVLPASAGELCGPDTGAVALPLTRHFPVVETGLLRRRSEPPTPPVRRFLRLALDTPEPDMLGPAFARRRP